MRKKKFCIISKKFSAVTQNDFLFKYCCGDFAALRPDGVQKTDSTENLFNSDILYGIIYP